MANVTSDWNLIKIEGDLDIYSAAYLLSEIYKLVNRKGFSDITLDFSNCTRAFLDSMLPICSRAQFLWKKGVDLSLMLPKNDKLNRLFINSNWAYLIDHRSFPKSQFRGYQHSTAIVFRNEVEQFSAVEKIFDTLLVALKNFSRNELAYIEWCINEITDNVLVHSNSEVGGIIQVTNFPSKSKIMVCVSDPGIGIPHSLSQAVEYKNLSDTELLSKAIEEGVTRDKSIGQGNGLYGSLRICHFTEGSFKLFSGKACLISKKGATSVKKSYIPYSGTLVVAEIGYEKRFDLSDALLFQGRTHRPMALTEIKYEKNENGDIIFKLKNESNGFGSRYAGVSVRKKILDIINNMDNNSTLIIDFDEIHIITSSYADEVFGKAIKEVGITTFISKIKFKNIDKMVESIINKAIAQRMNS